MAAAVLSGGCSLLFHADASQCSSTTDCRNRGNAFLGMICQAGTCVMPIAEAGADTGSDAGVDAAEAGVDAGPPCNPGSSAMAPVGNDCSPFITDPAYSEVACAPDTKTCIQLTTPECPFVIGDWQYSKFPPIFAGAFATIPTNQGAQKTHPSYLNYVFAVSEFNNTGIPAGPGGAYRMPVLVICNANPQVTDTAMQHLVNDVHVPGVITPLSTNLASTYSAYGANGSKAGNLFFINPFGADSTLTILPQGTHQLWHMLGAPGDVASAYAALMPRVEQYVRTHLPWSLYLNGGQPLKVATYTAGAPVLRDLAQAVNPLISWNNGQSSPQIADPATYLSVTTVDSVLTGAPLVVSPPSALQSEVTGTTGILQPVVDFQPHVVISFASDEFVSLLQAYETVYTAQYPPFWIVGPYNNDSPTLRSDVASTQNANLRNRIIGVKVASATDTSVLKTYEQAFVAAGNPSSALGAENYYDAVYLMIDSLIAAGGKAGLTGPDLGLGMTRLVDPTGKLEAMGATDIPDVSMTLLSVTPPNTVNLDGTLGPPIFDPATGARKTQGDIYCANAPVDAGVFAYDQMRVVPSSDGGAPGLVVPEGGGPCFGDAGL